MRRTSLLLVTFSIAACNAQPNDDAAVTPLSGEDVYRLRVDGGNTFTCATCHALAEPAADGLRRPGHALTGAPGRTTYKNGQLTNFSDAVNSCLTEWMNAQPWSADDRRLTALSDFLEGPSDLVEFQVVPPPAVVEGGSIDAGRALFNQSCVVCHGQDAVGTNKAPGLAGLGLDPSYIARRIRTSGLAESAVYDGLTGGRMPFWAADRLSDDELRDLAAFIEASDAPEPMEPQMPIEPMGRTCGATHESIGQTATLSNNFHGVSGEAVILDDCTIELRNFFYDGAGIDVQVYAARGGRYGQGFSISHDLVRNQRYEGETVVLTLPEGRTLDELDGISVWCVAVGVDFGSGTFR